MTVAIFAVCPVRYKVGPLLLTSAPLDRFGSGDLCCCRRRQGKSSTLLLGFQLILFQFAFINNVERISEIRGMVCVSTVPASSVIPSNVSLGMARWERGSRRPDSHQYGVPCAHICLD